MTTVTYILVDNSEFVIEAEAGQNLMQLALDNGLEGIEGACGGSCMCATCHVFIEEMLGVKAEERHEMEEEILEMEIDNPCPKSRLGCQFVIPEGMISVTARIANTSHF